MTLGLGQNVKRYRQAAKLLQMNLAFESEMERSHVSRTERDASNPSLFALATICHVLKITLSELFEGITDTIAPTSQGGPKRLTEHRNSRPILSITLRFASSQFTQYFFRPLLHAQVGGHRLTALR